MSQSVSLFLTRAAVTVAAGLLLFSVFGHRHDDAPAKRPTVTALLR
jgi:hypothetical protein